MLRIINESNASVFQYAITDTATGEPLLAANSLIELFLSTGLRLRSYKRSNKRQRYRRKNEMSPALQK